jgi:hypothetical protein
MLALAPPHAKSRLLRICERLTTLKGNAASRIEFVIATFQKK